MEGRTRFLQKVLRLLVVEVEIKRGLEVRLRDDRLLEPQVRRPAAQVPPEVFGIVLGDVVQHPQGAFSHSRSFVLMPMFVQARASSVSMPRDALLLGRLSTNFTRRFVARFGEVRNGWASSRRGRRSRCRRPRSLPGVRAVPRRTSDAPAQVVGEVMLQVRSVKPRGQASEELVGGRFVSAYLSSVAVS